MSADHQPVLCQHPVADRLDQPKSTGAVVPMLDGRGNPYPEFLRTQQVGLNVAKAVRGRIDHSLAGGPIRLKTIHLGESGKELFRQYLLAKLLPELFGDPLPVAVKPAKRVVSPKAIGLLDERLNAAFDPPGAVLDLPGLRLTSADLFDLLTLVQDELMADVRL